MKSKTLIREGLIEARNTGEAVELEVIGEEHPRRGFVASVEPKFAGLNAVTDESGLDGTWLIRLDQVTALRRGTEILQACTFRFG